jgi:hypothetical protein
VFVPNQVGGFSAIFVVYRSRVCAVSRPAFVWFVFMAGLIRYYRIAFPGFAELCEKVWAGGFGLLRPVDLATTASPTPQIPGRGSKPAFGGHQRIAQSADFFADSDRI